MWKVVGASEIFLGFICNCLILWHFLHNCKDHFHLYSLTAVHSYDLYHIHITSLYFLSCQFYLLIQYFPPFGFIILARILTLLDQTYICYLALYCDVNSLANECLPIFWENHSWENFSWRLSSCTIMYVAKEGDLFFLSWFLGISKTICWNSPLHPQVWWSEGTVPLKNFANTRRCWHFPVVSVPLGV